VFSYIVFSCSLRGMVRHSGLQRSVLNLYRKCLRVAGRKPIDTRDNFRRFAREEFRANAGINKKDFSTIEYLLRKGQRQLDIYSSEGVRNVGH